MIFYERLSNITEYEINKSRTVIALIKYTYIIYLINGNRMLSRITISVLCASVTFLLLKVVKKFIAVNGRKGNWIEKRFYFNKKKMYRIV